MKNLIDRESDSELQTAFQEMLDGCLEHPDQRQWYAIWTISLHDGTHIGDIDFKGLNPDGMVELGYGICPAYQGQGYATEAVQAMTAWASNQPGVTRVEAETEPANYASQRVLAKAGFRDAGVMGEEGPRFLWTTP